MSTLHLLNSHSSDTIDQCLRCLGANDALLLTGSGVYCHSHERLQALSCPIYALEEDVLAAGLQTAVDTPISLVDMAGFVGLTETHLRQISWA